MSASRCRRAACRSLRFLVAAAAMWCALVEIAECVAQSRFGMVLDGDWILLLTGSSSADRAAFLRMYMKPLALAAALFAAVAAAVAFAALRLSARAFALFAAALAVAAAARIACVGSVKAWKPVYVAFDTVRSARDYGRVGEAGRWTDERAARARPAPEGATNYVFVIGESLTSARVPFFGYGGRTMPRLEALGDALAALGPVRAASPYTVTALVRLLVADGASAPVWFRLAGYHTGFVGAHDRWGRYCSVEAAIFAACERKVYLSDLNAGARTYDGQLLPHAAEMMKAEPFALFVHMIGSHFDPATRVPDGFAEGEGLDGYDRSVRYTDEVLASLIGMLPPRTELFFVSDHGESVDTGGWRNMRSEAMWHVPMFAYPASAAPSSATFDGFVEAWRSRAENANPRCCGGMRDML